MVSDTRTGLVVEGAADDVGISGYRVYDAGGVLLADSASSPILVSGLTADSAQTLTVQAYDAAGNESVNGPSVSVTTLGSDQVKLFESLPKGQNFFGSSVALEGTRAVVGASHEDESANNSGKLYVYEQTLGGWLPVAELKASDASVNDNLGFVGLDLSGDTILAGAWHADPQGGDSGAAYVFTQSGGVWSEQQKLIASDGQAGDDFGRTVAIDGDVAVIGARDNNDVGAAYVFARSGGVWSEQQKLVASDGSTLFGSDVAVSGNRVVVGSRWSNDGSRTRAGAVYVLSLIHI